MSYHVPGSAFGPPVGAPRVDAPLVLLFERDDALAVPLLSQLRLAGYDVRAARTPVELFDAAQKHAVALMVVDLGNAAASRREFWVALDAQRRGRAIQVVTFRVVTPGFPPESDLDATPHALADLEIGGPQEVPLLVEAVRQRIAQIASSGLPAAHQATPPYGSPAVRLPSALTSAGAPASPFAHPASSNPFASADATSPFDQPDSGNPFAQTQSPAAPSSPFAGQPAYPYAPNAPNAPYAPSGPGWPSPTPDGGGSFARLPAMPPGFPPGANAQPFGAQPFGPLAGLPPLPVNGHNGNGKGNGHAAGPQPTLQPGYPGAAPWSQPPAGPPSFPGQHFSGSPTGAPPAIRPNSSAPPMTGAPVTDAWAPPDGAPLPADPVLPTAAPASPPPSHSWPAGGGRNDRDEPSGGPLSPGSGYDATPVAADPPSPRYVAGFPGDSSDAYPQAERSTAPVPAWVSPRVPLPSELPGGEIGGSGGLTLPEERALSTVLVEGALLSPQQLAVLKDVRRILNGVDAEFKLGELALLLRFLSPDQLLAALLVSRRLITPEQIAALGRIKQEMAASGMHYDLETLLVMFHIMTREDLEQLRAELA